MRSTVESRVDALSGLDTECGPAPPRRCAISPSRQALHTAHQARGDAERRSEVPANPGAPVQSWYLRQEAIALPHEFSSQNSRREPYYITDSLTGQWTIHAHFHSSFRSETTHSAWRTAFARSRA